MKTTWSKALWIFCVAFFVPFNTAGAGTLWAGASVADITPDPTTTRVPSCGYGARGRKPMKGVHDPIRCKALVLTDQQEEIAIVTCDLVGVFPTLRKMVLDNLQGS